MVQTSADPLVLQKSLEKKREILHAASRVFRRRGLQSTGMRDIATELNMAVGNLYYYFKDKEALLAFVQEDTLEALLELADRVRSQKLRANGRLFMLIEEHVVLLNEEIPGSLAHLEVEALSEPWRRRVQDRRDALRARLPGDHRGGSGHRHLPPHRSQGQRHGHPGSRELDRQMVPARRQQDRPADREGMRGVVGAGRGGRKDGRRQITMKKPRIYTDRSVIGGCFDDEFSTWSNSLMNDFAAGTFMPVLSDMVTAEIQDAPDRVRERYESLLRGKHEFVLVTEEVINLAEAYQRRKILTPKFYDDGVHIALASVAEADLVVSWNFKHIVHFDKIRLFNAVNLEQGYKPLQIYSPREVTRSEGG